MILTPIREIAVSDSHDTPAAFEPLECGSTNWTAYDLVAAGGFAFVDVTNKTLRRDRLCIVRIHRNGKDHDILCDIRPLETPTSSMRFSSGRPPKGSS